MATITTVKGERQRQRSMKEACRYSDVTKEKAKRKKEQESENEGRNRAQHAH